MVNGSCLDPEEASCVEASWSIVGSLQVHYDGSFREA